MLHHSAHRAGNITVRVAFALALVAVVALGLAVLATSAPAPTGSAPPTGTVVKDVVTGDVAEDARAYLRVRNVKKLTAPLAELLDKPERFLVKSQAHPLLGKRAPDFLLVDSAGKNWRLSQQLAQGPVVLIFYFGYHCNHCVGQLFAVNEDLPLFQEVGAQVVAVSADKPADTQARFKQYGAFGFPVLSDPGYAVAQGYGMLEPPKEKQVMVLLHGTFVIGRDGVVTWCQFGDEPFTGNRTLLYEVAKADGLLP